MFLLALNNWTVLLQAQKISLLQSISSNLIW